MNNTEQNTNKPNNIKDEGTIPEIDRKQEFAELDKLLELSKNSLPVKLEATGSSKASSPILEAVENFNKERLGALQSLKYQEKPEEEDDILFWETKSPSSSYAEAFPWFEDAEGKKIDFDKPIRLFDGVKIISRYLETRHRVDPDLISEAKLTEILELFQDNETITVTELYDHVSKFYKEDQNFFSQKLTTETDNLSESLLTYDSNTSRPFGQYGEVTLNQIGVALKENLKDINWELVYDKTRLTVHGVPVAVNAIGYGLLVKSYMKYVHNKPMAAGLSPSELKWQRAQKNRYLGLFCIIGAPLTMFLLRSSTIPFKDMFTLTVGGGSQVETNNSNLINSSLFLFLSNLNKKIPSWLKILFKFLFVTILVLKLLGFSLWSVFLINAYIWKIAYYIILSLVISYHLLSLYLLHKFSNKNIKISEVLPEFVIQWLKEIEGMSSSSAGIKEFKTSCYIEITIYTMLLILIVIATNF